MLRCGQEILSGVSALEDIGGFEVFRLEGHWIYFLLLFQDNTQIVAIENWSYISRWFFIVPIYFGHGNIFFIGRATKWCEH
jgi:hypothetical protein